MNYLHLIQYPSYTIQTHGGPTVIRVYKLYINGHFIREYSDRSKTPFDYVEGKYFDKAMAQEISIYERALDCKCIRGRSKTNVQPK